MMKSDFGYGTFLQLKAPPEKRIRGPKFDESVIQWLPIFVE